MRPEGQHLIESELCVEEMSTIERQIRKNRGEKGVLDAFPHPGVAEGVAGMKFVQAAVISSKKKGAWTRV